MELSPFSGAVNSAATQEFPRILWNPKVYYRYKSPPLVPILSQVNPYHPNSLRSILILSTHLRIGLPSCLFPLLYSVKWRWLVNNKLERLWHEAAVVYVYLSKQTSVSTPSLRDNTWARGFQDKTRRNHLTHVFNEQVDNIKINTTFDILMIVTCCSTSSSEHHEGTSFPFSTWSSVPKVETERSFGTRYLSPELNGVTF
jgi:hypothetical protein